EVSRITEGVDDDRRIGGCGVIGTNAIAPAGEGQSINGHSIERARAIVVALKTNISYSTAFTLLKSYCKSIAEGCGDHRSQRSVFCIGEPFNIDPGLAVGPTDQADGKDWTGKRESPWSQPHPVPEIYCILDSRPVIPAGGVDIGRIDLG